MFEDAAIIFLFPQVSWTGEQPGATGAIKMRRPGDKQRRPGTFGLCGGLMEWSPEYRTGAVGATNGVISFEVDSDGTPAIIRDVRAGRRCGSPYPAVTHRQDHARPEAMSGIDFSQAASTLQLQILARNVRTAVILFLGEAKQPGSAHKRRAAMQILRQPFHHLRASVPPSPECDSPPGTRAAPKAENPA